MKLFMRCYADCFDDEPDTPRAWFWLEDVDGGAAGIPSWSCDSVSVADMYLEAERNGVHPEEIDISELPAGAMDWSARHADDNVLDGEGLMIFADVLDLDWLTDEFWGGVRDVASETEDHYEATHGASAVYWTSDQDGVAVPTDALAGRPNEYETHGYTSDYEGWGQETVRAALQAGCRTQAAVLDYMLQH